MDYEVEPHQVGWLIALGLLSATLLGCFFAPSAPEPTEAQLATLDTGDTAWMLAATGLVLFMTPGLAFFYGGMVAYHSIISTMLQCIICLAVVSIIWVLLGFSLAFGDDWGGVIGNPITHICFRNVGGAPSPIFAPTIPFQLYALFQLKFAAITPALAAGGYIERIRFGPFLVYVTLYCLIVYCPVAHWVWHPDGFLSKWEVKDFAGGLVVHVTGGTSALAGALMLGPRRATLRGEKMHPNNVPYVILGTGMLWFGWFGFNAGSELAANQIAAQAFANTNCATAAAMFMWLNLDGVFGRKLSAVEACVGAAVGMVVITPACGFVTIGYSFLIGGLGAVVCKGAVWVMHHLPIDDGLDAFATHGVGGMLGALLTGAFIADTKQRGLGYFSGYLISIVIVFLWTFSLTCALFKAIDMVYPIRLDPEEESYGLDETQHGESLHKGAGVPGWVTQPATPLTSLAPVATSTLPPPIPLFSGV